MIYPRRSGKWPDLKEEAWFRRQKKGREEYVLSAGSQQVDTILHITVGGAGPNTRRSTERGQEMREREMVIEQLAIETYGRENQIEKAIEEMAELTVALKHHKDNKITRDKVVTEIADVIIMMDQLRIIYGVDVIDAEIKRKLDRLSSRLTGVRK